MRGRPATGENQRLKETTDTATKPTKGWLQQHWLLLSTLFALVAMYCFALRTGAAFVYFGYVWADTCWLIKLGQLIAESGAPPKTDLFSFTLPLLAQQGNPQPYVIYQWLAELVLYWGYRLLNPVGLLMAGSLIMTLAFLTIPIRACIRANAPAAWSLLAVIAASLSANVRCVIRPEIFSYLNLAICLALLQPLREERADTEAKTNSINWSTVVALSLLMAVWSNLHSGFVTGLILVALYTLCFLLEDWTTKKSLSGPTKTLLSALAISGLATLINPYGVGLWFYLPHLFFMPINAEIDECKPLFSLTLYRAIYFYCVTALCWGALAVRAYKTWKSDPATLRSPVRQSGLLLALIATCLGLWMRRLTPFAAIVMVVETANYIGDKVKVQQWLNSFWRRKSSYLAFELAMLACAASGVLAIAGSSVTVPASTQDFKPPFSAVDFLIKEHNGGRVFSSLPISDMLDMYWGPHAALFIDSRMDAYSEEIIQDYLAVLYGKPNWRDVLDRYQIKWIFLSPEKPMCRLLEAQPEWEVVYRDPSAIIFRRR